MILELYILLQILALALLFFGWRSHNPLLWGIGFIMFGVQALMSYNIEYIVAYLQNGEVLTQTINYDSIVMSWLNIGAGFFCLIMFFIDIFMDVADKGHTKTYSREED